MIEPMHWCETDKKLRPSRIRIRPARHRENTALVWMIVKLGLDVVIGSAFAVAVLCRIFRIRIAALNHEFLNDPMENRAVVKTLSRKFFEILDRIWCRIGPKLHDHIAFAGLDYCDFVG